MEWAKLDVSMEKLNRVCSSASYLHFAPLCPSTWGDTPSLRDLERISPSIDFSAVDGHLSTSPSSGDAGVALMQAITALL